MAETLVIRYRTKPERAEENATLVRDVFEELQSVAPGGFAYATVQLADGVSFVHVAQHEGDNPLSGLSTFAAFLDGIEDRCDEPPVASGATVVGSYGLALR